MRSEGLLDDAEHHAHGDGDEGATNHQTEEDGHNVIKRAHLAGGEAQRLEYRLQAMTNMHKQAADSHDVEYGTPGIGESSHNVVIAIVRVPIHRKLPQVEQQEAENHYTRQHHGTRGQSRLQRAFLLVMSAGVNIFQLEYEGKNHMNQQDSEKTKTNGHQHPGRHGVQTRSVVVNPRRTAENSHITGKVTHEEQEEARPRKCHKDFAADRGRDELACCRDNIVHKCNNVFAGLTVPHPGLKSKHQSPT